MRFRWQSLLFLHWRVPVTTMRQFVPADVEIDTFEGSAWIGLVPFTMRDVRHTRLPPIPTMHHFHECNVRTYVTRDGEPGVWFLSLDAVSRLAVWGGRRRWNLNYKHASIELHQYENTFSYAVDRIDAPPASLLCCWRIGDDLRGSRPGELAHFLTERYMLYTRDRKGRLLRGRIWHEPWSLRSAVVTDLNDTLVAAAGIDIDQDLKRNPPVVHAADEISVQAWKLERVED